MNILILILIFKIIFFTFKENICKFNETLNHITKARLSIKEEVLKKFKTKLQEATTSASVVPINDDHCSQKHLIGLTPGCHPIITEEDYILSVYDQFVNSPFMTSPMFIPG